MRQVKLSSKQLSKSKNKIDQLRHRLISLFTSAVIPSDAFTVVDKEIATWNKIPSKSKYQIAKSDLDSELTSKQLKAIFKQLNDCFPVVSLENLQAMDLLWTKLSGYLPSLNKMTTFLDGGNERSLLGLAQTEFYSSVFNFFLHVKNHPVVGDVDNNVSKYIKGSPRALILFDVEGYRFDVDELFDQKEWSELVQQPLPERVGELLADSGIFAYLESKGSETKSASLLPRP